MRAVHRCLNGDAEAFESLVLKYGDRMLSFCRSRSATEEDAADAAQDAFVRAYRSLRTFRLGGSFAAWLFAIAANRTRTGWRRRFAEAAKAARCRTEAEAAPAADPEADAIRRLEGAQVRSAVARLGGNLRTAVDLYYFAELSVSEVSQVLGIGEEAVKSRLFRARSRLRKSLAPRNRGGPREVS